MKQVIFLSVILSISLFFINDEVLASREKRSAKHFPKYVNLTSKDPRVQPEKYCESKCAPTVRPFTPFNPTADAEAISKAIKGPGTREDTIINILTKRTEVQRLEIIEAYTTRFGPRKDMVLDVKRDTSGMFDQAIVKLMTPMPVLYAEEIQATLTTLEDVNKTIVEIPISLTNYGIKTIAEVYQIMYEKPLDATIKERITSPDFQKLILSLFQAKRDENSTTVDDAKVVADAQAIHKIGKGNWKTNMNLFNDMFVTRSYSHLNKVFAEYKKISSQDIEVGVKSEFTGEMRDAYHAIVKRTKNKPRYLAERLYENMRGLGVSDRALIRIIIPRSDIDLADIKTAYQDYYGKPLEGAIAFQIGGHYRRVITFLVRG